MYRDVSLRIGSTEFTGWKSASVTRSIESLCGSFSVVIYPKEDDDLGKIPPNVEVDIMLGKEQVLRGIVDSISSSLSDRGLEVTLSGRSRTADIVDCSAMNLPGKWKETDLLSLSKSLLKPFGIKVVNELSSYTKFPFKLQSGESPFEALNRANEFQGALMLTDPIGRFIITKPGTVSAQDSIRYGENVMSAEMSVDYSSRFSEYTVKGQKRVKDSSGWTSTREVNFQASATDPVISSQRYRPKLFMAEAQATETQAQNRANLEASVRAAKSMELRVVLDGWKQRDGSLWPLNSLVFVNLPHFQIEKRQLLITSVTYFKGFDDGATTELILRRKDAYDKLIKKAVRESTVNKYGW